MAKALVLRNSNTDGTSYGGFRWPESGLVEAPDWNAEPECGGGLHGLLWGQGDWSLLREGPDTLWQVVEVDTRDLVKIDGNKVKFRRGNVVYSGNMAEAMTHVLCDSQHHTKLPKNTKPIASGPYSTAASSGDGSKAASSGRNSTAASSGFGSKAASSGRNSTVASSGRNSTAASSGRNSTAASSGRNSTAASSGDDSKAASSGDWSNASTEGKRTIAVVAGFNGCARAGEGGIFVLPYEDKTGKINVRVGRVGVNGIKADTWYRVQNGKLVRTGEKQ